MIEDLPAFVECTPRVLEIAEGFSLGLSEKEFVIYNNLSIQIEQGDVVYITGQSGSGKSLRLRDLVTQMRKDGLKVADLNSIELDEKPVIELIGDNTVKATDYLAKAGISDAWIYIRKPSELSDDQCYRLKLAKVMESDADVWGADEFGAVLDRVSARVVVFNIAKVVRPLGKILMVATTHTDLIDELAPNLTITRCFTKKLVASVFSFIEYV